MRTDWSHLEQWRVYGTEELRSQKGMLGGAFLIPHPEKGHLRLEVLAVSGTIPDAEGWDHVSVKVRDLNRSVRLPGWLEMEFVRKLFWEEHETVLQFHVPVAQHINEHPAVLHLWKHLGTEVQLPPSHFV